MSPKLACEGFGDVNLALGSLVRFMFHVFARNTQLGRSGKADKPQKLRITRQINIEESEVKHYNQF